MENNKLTKQDLDNFDVLTYDILKYAVDENNISIATIQRVFTIGYPRAEKIITFLANNGFISKEGYPREIYITQKQFSSNFNC